MKRSGTERSNDITVVQVMSEALDSLSVAVCLFDHDLRALHWNRTFLELFPEHAGHVCVGEPYRENLRRFYASRLDAEELPHLERYIADGIARHTTQSLPFVFKHRDQWLRVASLPIGELGRIRIWSPIAPPSGETSTPLALAAGLEGPGGHSINAVADGMMLVGPDGRIAAVNDRFLMLYRLGSRGDAMGKTYPDLLGSLAGAEAERHAARVAFADNQRFAGAPFEVPLPEDRWIRVIEQRAADGTIVSTHLDITEMRRLQRDTAQARAHAEAANRWLSLAEQIAHVGHWRLDLPGRQMAWSEELYRIAGRPTDSAVPDWPALALTCAPEDRAVVETALDRAIAERCEFQVAFRLTRPDGDVRHVVARGIPQLDSAGNLAALFGVIADETEHRLAEEKLRQSEKMQVVGRLAAGVAHDFNNILQVVMGNVEMMRLDLPPDSATMTRAADVLQEAQRGADLTHNLLAYARRQVLTPARLELPRLMRDLRDFLGRILGARIALTLDVPPDVPGVLADRAQLLTALMNLAINAMHAMPNGGGLQLRVEEARAAASDALAPGDYVVISVADTGVGMPPEVRARAFDPFFTTKGGEGVGLGLAMVQGFSEQSGGTARLFSEPGAGTRVELWLPAATDAPVADAAGPSPGTVAGSRGNILVADDQPAVLRLAATVLRHAGFTVTEAADGQAALDAVLAGGSFDAIVTDHVMPGLTGVDLIARVRAIRPGVPSLIMSGFAEIANFDAALHDSVILNKPFRIEALVEAVNRLLARSPPVRS